MNRNVKSYLRKVSSKLKGTREQKKDYMANLQNDVIAAFGDDETVTVEQLYAEFGMPDVIAHGFEPACNYDSMAKRNNRTVAIFTAVVVALSLLLSATIYIIVETVNASNGTYSVSVDVSDNSFE